MGRFLGSGRHAATNLAAIALLLVLTAGIAAIFLPTRMDPTTYWTEVAKPLLALLFGFLLGKAGNEPRGAA